MELDQRLSRSAEYLKSRKVKSTLNPPNEKLVALEKGRMAGKGKKK